MQVEGVGARLRQLAADLPPDPAFQEHVSGLLVPREHVRTRQVWTSQERQLLNRVTKMLNTKDVFLELRCQDEACQREPIQRRETGDGGFTLICRHAERVFQRAF